GTPGTASGDDVVGSAMPNTSARLLAGSVETMSTRRPASASAIAAAAAHDVLPTPPLPVKNRYGVGAARTPVRISVRALTVLVMSAASGPAAAGLRRVGRGGHD